MPPWTPAFKLTGKPWKPLRRTAQICLNQRLRGPDPAGPRKRQEPRRYRYSSSNCFLMPREQVLMLAIVGMDRQRRHAVLGEGPDPTVAQTGICGQWHEMLIDSIPNKRLTSASRRTRKLWGLPQGRSRVLHTNGPLSLPSVIRTPPLRAIPSRSRIWHFAVPAGIVS